MFKRQTLALGASLALFSIGAFAQGTATPKVDARQGKQETNIYQQKHDQNTAASGPRR